MASNTCAPSVYLTGTTANTRFTDVQEPMLSLIASAKNADFFDKVSSSHTKLSTCPNSDLRVETLRSTDSRHSKAVCTHLSPSESSRQRRRLSSLAYSSTTARVSSPSLGDCDGRHVRSFAIRDRSRARALFSPPPPPALREAGAQVDPPRPDRPRPPPEAPPRARLRARVPDHEGRRCAHGGPTL